MTEDRRTRLLGWLQLLRVPNLPTVPGDALAGAALAAAGRSVLPLQACGVLLASLLLYMAGLVLNDVHDLPDDRHHRPERPLPRGAVSVRAALRAFVLLAALGTASAASTGLRTALASLVLLALICLYDLRAKLHPGTACLVMGLCRGTSMMLGAVALGRPAAALAPAGALTVYIGAVTWLSRREDETQRPGGFLLLLPLALVGGWSCAAWSALGTTSLPTAAVASCACLVVAAGSASHAVSVLFRQRVEPGLARTSVGRFIGLLLPWQAALVFLGGTRAASATGVVLLLAWPLSRGLARRFSAS